MAAKSVSPAMRTSSFSGGLKIGPPLPPAFSNLVHWWDATDPTQVFKDAAGTMQALNGDPVLHIANKGSDGTPLDSLFTGSFVLNTNVINGLQVVGDTAGVSILKITSFLPAHFPTATTLASVGRVVGPPVVVADLTYNVARTEWGNSPNHITVEEGGTEYDLGQSPVQDQWVWIYGSFAGGDNNSRVSGGSEINGTEAYTADAGDVPSVTLDDAEFAESLRYDIAFTPALRTSLISYFDQKYGVLPFVT